jgi:hydrogenase expression/formation protein HypC
MNEEPDGVGGRPACIGDVCITCSDMAVEVRVVRLLDDAMAVVDTGAGEETVSVALVSARVGDSILVHAREAIAVVGAGSAGTAPARTAPAGTGSAGTAPAGTRP